MDKCSQLFGKKHKEFVRVFLFGNKSKLEHFKSGLLVSCLLFDSKGQPISKSGQNSGRLLDLLTGLNLPIELVISHRSMACKLFSVKVSDVRNINKVAKHALNDSHCNTVFYGKLTEPNARFCIRKNFTYGVCTCDISDNITKLLLNNSYRLRIISTSVFPLWVTSAFFSYCKNNILTPVLFVIEYIGYLHVILTNNGYVIYNRSITLEGKDKDVEVHNTLNHIKNVIDININDLIIYEFGNKVVDYLSSCSEIKMRVISTDFDVASHKHVENSIFKIACLVFFCILFSDTLTNAYKINEINKQTGNIKTEINNSHIAKDIDAWHELFSKNLLNQPDYENAIKEYTRHRTEKLQNITMYCEGGDKISVTEDINDNNTVTVDSNIITNIDDTSTADNDDYNAIIDNVDPADNCVTSEDDDNAVNEDDMDKNDFTENYTDDYCINESVTVNA